MNQETFSEFEKELVALCSKFGLVWVIDGCSSHGMVQYFDPKDEQCKDLNAYLTSIKRKPGDLWQPDLNS